jgi:hypothetical protein
MKPEGLHQQVIHSFLLMMSINQDSVKEREKNAVVEWPYLAPCL